MSDAESDEQDSQQLDPYSDDSDSQNRRQARFTCTLLNLSKRHKHQTLKEHIRNEYKKYGTVKNVILDEKEDNRVAVVFLSEKREVRRACEATDGRYLFNAILDVYDSSESDRHEFPFFSSRTLFIGNLEKVTTYEDLKRQFFKYGKILKIDLKKINGVTRYAFVQFAKLDDARLAVHRMQREKLGKNIVATCYARSIKSQVLWFSGSLPHRGHDIDPEYGEQFFRRVFEQFGTVRSLILDRRSPKQSQILVAYSDVVGSNKAYIEFKENRRKLVNSRWSCDFASEELVQSVTDDMHKNNVLSRSEIINHWGDIIAKLKKAQEDDEFRMIGSDYEYRKYTKLSERIDRDNSAERKRYRSRDSRSRSRERYRSKRSRSRSRGRDSPRRKKSKGTVSFGRVHSPQSPRGRRGDRRRGSSSTSSSSYSRSRSRSPDGGKSRKKMKKSRKSRYERKKKRSSRERKKYRERRGRSESKTSTSGSSTDRSTSTDRSSSRKRMMDLSEAQLEQMRKNLSQEIQTKHNNKPPFDSTSPAAATYNPKVTIDNDHFKNTEKADAESKRVTSTTATGNVVVSKVNKPIELAVPHKLPLPSQKVLDEMLGAKKNTSRPTSPVKTHKISEDTPVKKFLDRRHLKDEDLNATPTQDEEEKQKHAALTSKKSAPIVLPVLPVPSSATSMAPKTKKPGQDVAQTSPVLSSSREKPREETLMSPKRSHQQQQVAAGGYSGTAMGKHGKKKQMAQKASTSLQNGNSHNSNATAEIQEKEAKKRKEEQKKKELHEAKKKSQTQPANPKKSFLLRAGPKKKFLEDPMRAIGDEDYNDFRKEILQLLSEVRQEAEHLPEADEPYVPVLQKTPPRENPSLEHLFECNNTWTPAPHREYADASGSSGETRKLPFGARITKKTSSGSGVMEQAKVQTYLQRIIKPEEFLIDSNVKRWDIFEEDRKRIEKSPWMSADGSTESPFVDKPGVFDFYQDWNSSIQTDLEHLSAAVNEVLGIGVQQPVQSNTEIPAEKMEQETFFPKEEPFNSASNTGSDAGFSKTEPIEDHSLNGEMVKTELEDADNESEKLKMLQHGSERRGSTKSEKEHKKEKKERSRERKKSRKTSSDVEGAERKSHKEKKQTGASPSRKISASSQESAAHSSSPTSEMLSPKPSTEPLDIQEVDKTNQSVRERMEDMMRRKTKSGSSKKKSGKYRRASVPENDDEGNAIVNDAVKNLSFEDKNEAKETEGDQKADTKEDCDRNAELDAALAGLEEDYEAPKKKPETVVAVEKPFEPKLPPAKVVKDDQKAAEIKENPVAIPKPAQQETPTKKSEPLFSPIPADLPQNLFRKRFKLQERRPSFKSETTPEPVKKSEIKTEASQLPETPAAAPPAPVTTVAPVIEEPQVKVEAKPQERNTSPFRAAQVAPKLSSPVKVSLPDRRHSQSEVIKSDLLERVERKLSTASGTSEISNASNSGFSTPVQIQLPSNSKLETIVPPASKRYTPGPIRLAGASTTLHPAQKPTGIMTIQQPTIQTIQPTALSPRLTAVMVPRPVILTPSTPASLPQGALRANMPLTTQAQIITGPRMTTSSSASQQVIIQRPVAIQSGTVINAQQVGQGQKTAQVVSNFIAPQSFGTVRMYQPIGQGRQVLVNLPPSAHSAYVTQKPVQKPEPHLTEKKTEEAEKTPPTKLPQSQIVYNSAGPASRVPVSRVPDHIVQAQPGQRVPLPPFISQQPQQSARPLSANDRAQLLERHKLLWQGYLNIKNDTATVHLNLIHGNADVPMEFLPREREATGQASQNRMATLKIVQRMRLEPNQLEKVAEQIEKSSTCCTMVALPCGTDERDVHSQTEALRKKFIEYLTEKRSAGIVNVAGGRSPHILHIFPPCEFTTNTLRRLAPRFLEMVHHLPMLLVVIAPQ